MNVYYLVAGKAASRRIILQTAGPLRAMPMPGGQESLPAVGAAVKSILMEVSL
ncbi:hypothetical protein [Desulfurivibrio alkaliphilus]|uniref:Uncharacterized protein n=1 Tax=Desulfurivibrio alkaliphilus (strain DSM 19089 / UNIQEM U267 / AHT2) TaxID=589865 RepID=D6Z431_DESAT|nr:hypothetical protein [Desulfurivibrio alkaliphilus]ADH86306.1 hypothetical protein DaAHT2_1611 [Desulfurivibrio alkaliphilus AHT 2]